MYLCNAQGLAGKKELFWHRLDTDLRNSIVCVTETWLNSNCTNSLICDTSKFVVFRSDRDNVRKKCGGGLLILVPSFLSSKLSFEPHSTDGFECLCVDVLGTSRRR